MQMGEWSDEKSRLGFTDDTESGRFITLLELLSSSGLSILFIVPKLHITVSERRPSLGVVFYLQIEGRLWYHLLVHTAVK